MNKTKTILSLVIIFFIGTSTFVLINRNSNPPQTTTVSANYTSEQIVSNPKYSITYTSYNQLYLFSILSSPYEQIISEAENEFLQKRQISKQDACKLNILISQPKYVEEKINPTYTKFTFCN